MDLIQKIKHEIEFGDKPVCNNCAKCEKYEKSADHPIILICHHEGKLTFEVEEDDVCQKWEEL